MNPIDFKTRSGLGFVSQTLGQRFHFVPGYVSGVVDALSDGVSQWAPGDAVYGMVNFPLLPVPARNMWWRMREPGARAPQSILAHAGGLPPCGLTAWQALFDVGGLQSGERVLVLAGAGGVGHLSVQLAAWKGATSVSATASPANHDFLRRHGAALALDYRDPCAVDHMAPGSDSGSDGWAVGEQTAGLAGATPAMTVH